jgi:hypothetical protein
MAGVVTAGWGPRDLRTTGAEIGQRDLSGSDQSGKVGEERYSD